MTTTTKITMPLKELSEAFQQSAADETLSVGERRLAAQMSVLSMHVRRIEGVAKRSMDAMGARIGQLETMLKAALSVETPVVMPATTPPAETKEIESEKAESDTEGDATIAQFLAESQAEERQARASHQQPPKPTLVPVDNKESA